MLVSDAPNSKNVHEISGGPRSGPSFQRSSMLQIVCSLQPFQCAPASSNADALKDNVGAVWTGSLVLGSITFAMETSSPRSDYKYC